MIIWGSFSGRSKVKLQAFQPRDLTTIYRMDCYKGMSEREARESFLADIKNDYGDQWSIWIGSRESTKETV